MKALSDVRLPCPSGSDREMRHAADTNQRMLNSNFRTLEDAIRDLEKRVKELEARCS